MCVIGSAVKKNLHTAHVTRASVLRYWPRIFSSLLNNVRRHACGFVQQGVGGLRDLLSSRGQEVLRLFARAKSAELSIARAVFCRVSRSKSDKLMTILFDNLGEVVAVAGRHMASATVGAIVIAHAGPFIGPPTSAARTLVVVGEPSHLPLLRLVRPQLAIANDSSRARQSRGIHDHATFEVAV
jgi:hypothetical protein